ncbi:hypothetical protein [Streptomyces sp. NPDC059874]|uniref:hypothetical protein n=1 Tax=Streptomyces sp. NPDC059874 TaxID=3346983 RepID=UPI003664B84F
MSTPEEQQQQQQHQERQQSHQDPYGTQTWQSDTWDTGYQPVHPPLGAVPGQPVAPEGWFRDEAPAGSAGGSATDAPWPQAQAQAPASAQAAGPWPDGAGAVSGSAAGAGVPWPEGPAAEAYPARQAQDPMPYQQAPAGQPAAPEGWFRDEVPAPAPARDWSRSAAPASADETAYLPPYPGPEPSAALLNPDFPQQAAAPASAAETAYLPPYPAPEAPAAQAAAPASAEETAYLPPYPGPEARAAAPYSDFPQQAAPASAEETAYLPPYPGPQAPAGGPYPDSAQLRAEGSAVPEGWFRDEVPAPAPAPDWSQGAGTVVSADETAYLPPYPGPGMAEEQQEAAPTAEPAADDTAWSPPTLAGNTLRAVDPAQARAEGRSPIIDPGPQSAILTAALGLLLALAAVLGHYAVLVPLVALQGLTAAGWFRLNGMWPARQGIALAFAGALVADAAVLAVDDPYGPGAIIGTLGAWVLITLVLQLRSHADPDERMYGLMASVASAALAIVCAGWLAADTAAVSAGAVAVAVAVFTRALPLPTAPSVGVSLAAAAGAGLVVGGLTDVGVGGALVGLVSGVCALIGLRVAAYDYPSKFVHMTAGVALPLAVAAPAVYLIGRVVS